MSLSYGINKLSVIAGRGDPSSKSEMVTQILFGETYKVLETYQDWLKVQLDTDSYACWINRLQHFELDESNYLRIQNSHKTFSSELLQIVQTGKYHFLVPMGAQFPMYENHRFHIGSTIYETYGKTIELNESEIKYNAQACVEFASMFLNAPYLWGGKTIMGIDCSGLVQICCALAGYQLPRDAKEQAKHGTPITFLDEVKPGDIAFFHNQEGQIVHTGILINQEYIIHASGRVRIDKIDHYGIYSPELKDHSHHLRVIKRLS